MTTTPLTLDAAQRQGAEFLEGHRWADRWSVADTSAHYCNDCGALINEDRDPDDGCSGCGFGLPLDDDMED
jgi:hypothetical protein